MAEEGGETDAFIGGGGTIYAQAIAYAQRIYLTRVHTKVAADVYFPAWDEKEWKIVHQEELEEAEGGGLASSFSVYERVKEGRGLGGQAVAE